MEREKFDVLVICAGLPRSGSTNLYNKVCTLLEVSARCVRHGRADNDTSDFFQQKKNVWSEEQDVWHVVKAIPTEEDYKNAKTGQTKILQVTRDIRDVAASALMRWGHNWEDQEKEIFEFTRMVHAKYNNFKHQRGTIQLNYEEVMLSEHDYLMTLAQFFEIDLSRKNLDVIMARTSIAVAQKTSSNSMLLLSRKMREASAPAVKLIKQILPKNYRHKRLHVFKKLSFLFPKINQETLVGPGHVSNFSGKPKSHIHVLNEETIAKLECLYPDLIHY